MGANLTSTFGDPLETVIAAFAHIERNIGPIVAVSRMFRTPAFPAGSGPDFVNAVAAIKTGLEPHAILAALHDIEAKAGRERAVRWGARTLDLDFLAYGDLVLPDARTLNSWIALAPDRQGREAPAELILPHPRIQDRAFVLIPLADICPNWRHPFIGATPRELIAALPDADKAAIYPI